MTTRGFHAANREVLRLSGPDTRDFLQGVVTNDVHGLDRGPVYAALLTPQGKYLFDFFLIADGDAVLLDVESSRAQALAQRLSLYRLRAKVEIGKAELSVVIGLGRMPEAAVPDPRDPELGWRLYTPDPEAALSAMEPLDPARWNALRIERGVPETGIELVPDDTYILEAGFERLHGVDFRKGCYVGQEVTARMKHKAELRKGLAPVRVEGEAPPPGTEILADGRTAGTLYSVAGGIGLAHLRFDRAKGTMTAGSARVTRAEPEG
ncbi:MAG TPA: folate-binding protein [Paracoccaceae bacterium]|nr:folate-binding protein [Paracoccaceae bacterium]